MPYYKATMKDFRIWLSQPIWISGNTKAFRGNVLKEFADDITGWMLHNGYTMDGRWNCGASGYKELTLWIYRIYVQEEARNEHRADVYIPDIIHRDTEEDSDQFRHVIDYDRVESFLGFWSGIEDVDPDTRVGTRIHTELQDFLYRFIDLDSSKQGKLIARSWDDSDGDSDNGWRKGDAYINDANEGYHGGKGSKV